MERLGEALAAYAASLQERTRHAGSFREGEVDDEERHADHADIDVVVAVADSVESDRILRKREARGELDPEERARLVEVRRDSAAPIRVTRSALWHRCAAYDVLVEEELREKVESQRNRGSDRDEDLLTAC